MLCDVVADVVALELGHLEDEDLLERQLRVGTLVFADDALGHVLVEAVGDVGAARGPSPGLLLLCGRRC